MKLQDVNVKSLLAIFIIVFGMVIISFVHLEDMVLGAIIGFIGVPLSYFFGASKTPGTTHIKDSNVYSDDIGGGGIKNPPPPPNEPTKD